MRFTHISQVFEYAYVDHMEEGKILKAKDNSIEDFKKLKLTTNSNQN